MKYHVNKREGVGHSPAASAPQSNENGKVIEKAVDERRGMTKTKHRHCIDMEPVQKGPSASPTPQLSFQIQLEKGKLRRKKKKQQQQQLIVWRPRHSQEEIQDFIVQIWLASPKDDLDRSRADYMDTYKNTEGGWCDGWAFALSQGNDGFADAWREIDEAMPDRSALSSQTSYYAVEAA